MNTATKATILDVDSLLDTQMDSVETMPDYVTPSKGVYQLKVKEAGIVAGKEKDGVKTNRLSITYEIAETLESDEAPYPNGSLFSERFTATEDGLKYFKKQATKILNVADMTGATLRDIMDGLQNVEFKAVITVRSSTGDNGKTYENVNVRPLHDAPAA